MEKKITKSVLVGLSLVSLLVVACGGIAPEEEALLDQESFSPETSGDNGFVKAEQGFAPEAWADQQAAWLNAHLKPGKQQIAPDAVVDQQTPELRDDLEPKQQPAPETLVDQQTPGVRNDLQPEISDQDDPAWDQANGQPAAGVADAQTPELRDLEPMGQPAPQGLVDGQTPQLNDDLAPVGQPAPEGVADGQTPEVRDGLGPVDADKLASQTSGQHNYKPAADAFNNRLWPR